MACTEELQVENMEGVDDVLLLGTTVGDTIRVSDGMIEGPNEGLRVLGAADGTTVDSSGHAKKRVGGGGGSGGGQWRRQQRWRQRQRPLL